MNGVMHITETFAELQARDRAALMPYLTLGFPTPEGSLEVIQATARAGADLIELGVPFSDPLADGPTIQRSTQAALGQGISVSRCLELVACLRQRGVSQPLLLMGYVNPILAYGAEKFVRDAAAAGADGLILPDLPPEEAGDLESACRTNGLALVYLLSPNSSPERIRFVASRSTGFVYLVSLTGVTGARKELPPALPDFIQRVRSATRLPLAVGFGISTPEQAAAVGALADGVIVGSALVDAIAKAGSDPASAAEEFVSGLSRGLHRMGHG